MGRALSGLDHLNYGYLDWMVKQGVLFTSSCEFLKALAARKNVYTNAASQASNVHNPQMAAFTPVGYHDAHG